MFVEFHDAAFRLLFARIVLQTALFQVAKKPSVDFAFFRAIARSCDLIDICI